MASIRKRGSNSYLIVVSRGYDYEGNRLKSVQKTVKPPKEYTPKQAEKWVREQAILFEREVQHTPEPINRSITLAKYIEHWVADVGPKKLADSTFRRDEQDIRRILPALGNYKLTDLRKEVIREFYEKMRHSPRLDGRGNLSEKSVEGLHNTLCGILSAAVDEGYLTHNPAWRCYKPKGKKKERPVADEETVKKLITAFEGQSMKYETYFKLVLATGLRRGEACGLKWSDINWRKRTIHVQRGVVKLSHQESITKDPKTTSGDRMVYLSKEMCQLLKAWRKECEWDRQQTANETVSEDDYLFRQPNGKPMNPCTFTYRFKLILKANNLPLDLNVHSLRHTNASLLISQGVDVRTVASLLGHVQASTTLLHCMADGAGNSRDIAKLLKGHGSFLSACFFYPTAEPPKTQRIFFFEIPNEHCRHIQDTFYPPCNFPYNSTAVLKRLQHSHITKEAFRYGTTAK